MSFAAATAIPVLGIPFALVVSFLRRWDRPVMVTSSSSQRSGVFLLSLLMGAGGSGYGTGS